MTTPDNTPQDNTSARPDQHDHKNEAKSGAKHLQGHWVLARLGKRVLRPGGRKLTSWMVDTANPTGKRVVELAPGLGLTAGEIFERRPASYVGVDADAQAVAATELAIAHQGKVVQAPADSTGLDANSADLVIGEAMLTMQGERGKAAIISEAWRILEPGGLYAIHELALVPDDFPKEAADDLRKALARSIKVNARPLTVTEWSELLEAQGFRVVAARTAPMGLLDPKQMIADEGPRVAKILMNLLRDSEARGRVLEMRRTFTQHKEHLAAVSLVCEKVDIHMGAPADQRAAEANVFNVLIDAPSATDGDSPAVQRLLSAEGVNLIAMRFKAGQSLEDHRSAHPITVQCLQGEVVFSIGERHEVLTPGKILHLPAQVTHRVDAKQDSVFLLSMLT